MFVKTFAFYYNTVVILSRKMRRNFRRKRKRKMGDIHTMTEMLTITEVAETYGRKPDTLWRKAKRTWPDRKWSIYSAVTEMEGRILLGDEKPAPSKPRKSKATPKSVLPPEHTGSVENHEINQQGPKAEQSPRYRRALLVALLIAPTVASVRNMFNVTAHLSESLIDAGLLTAVLSLSALGFIAAGVRRGWSLPLAILLIAFESFCNLVSIYGGLLSVGTKQYGVPTRFLGLVTDVFNSGTHGTALFLACVTAFFIAAVQYAAVFELNKK